MTKEQWDKVHAHAAAMSGTTPSDEAYWEVVRMLTEPGDENHLDEAAVTRQKLSDADELVVLEKRLAELKKKP